MRKKLALLLAAMMVFTIFAACAAPADDPASDPVNEPQQGTETPAPSEEPVVVEEPVANCTVSEDSDVVILHYSDVSTLFPADQTTIAEAFPSSLGYDTLLKLDADRNEVWMLGEGCDVSGDNLTYTFKLRQGITFSDGEAWNAEAMKANLDLWIGNSPYALKGVSTWSLVDSVEVVDEYTCALHLKETDGALLTKMANGGYMVSPKLIEAGPDVWGTTQAGTGQYVMKEFRFGESMTFELNRDWWGYDAEICGGDPIVDSNVGFNSIVVKPVSEEATRIAMLMSGEADIIMSVSARNTETIEATGTNKVINRISTMIGYLNFNLNKTPLQDVRVRHAIAYAIDVDKLNELVYGGANVVARSFSPDSVNYFVPQPLYDYDLEKAKSLMAEAGYSDGLNMILWSENDNTDTARADFIRQQLSEIGINVEVKCMDGASLTAGFDATGPEGWEWDLYMRGYSTSSGDACHALGRFASDKFMPVGANYPCYSNPEFDKYVKAGEKTIVPEERLAAYTEAQRIIWEDLPAYPTLISTSRAGVSNKVEGVGFKNNGNVDITQAVYVG